MPAWVALLAVAALASPQREPLPPAGRLVEGLRCESDPSQTYTLYLPSGYSSSRRWPALLVLDPRGRAVVAASLFRDGAEAHGWILLSSNDTRSDGPAEPNVKALQALWPEVHERYATDPRRIYAAGFSGGGMVAWDLGRLTGRLAGVIASGSRWEDDQFGRRIAFPCFGAAGDGDFNYAPMRAVHARLREWGTPERFEVFEGPHAWMPAALAGDAIAWMELQAMKAGLRPRDAALVAARLAEDTRRAQALEAGGRLLAAQHRFAAIVATFDGLADVSEARREAARLAGLPSTKAAR
jgi:dienelactone hydrolase